MSNGSSSADRLAEATWLKLVARFGMALAALALPVFAFLLQQWIGTFTASIADLKTTQQNLAGSVQVLSITVNTLGATIAEARAGATLREANQNEAIKQAEDDLRDIQRFLRDHAIDESRGKP